MTPSLRVVAILSVGLATLLAGSPGIALAQGNEVRSLTVELTRLRRDLDALQRYVYAGVRPPGGGQAAPAAGSATNDAQFARLQVRITELETEIRNLTGTIEVAGNKIDRARTRLDKLVEDVDFRLTALEREIARRAGADAASRTPAAVPTGGAGQGETARPATPGEPSAPGTLGTITSTDLARAGMSSTDSAAAFKAEPEPEPEPVRLLPEGTPKEQYNFAFRLLRQGDWMDAETALREFIGLNPDDPLSANAHYWLGETHYVRDDFTNAAVAFLEGYQKFSDSPKAPDSLLKLGKSLAKMGNKEEACTTFAKVLENFGDAKASIARLAEKERRLVGCN